MISTGFLLSCLALTLSWNGAFGCSCFPQHAQSQYCSSSFAFYGKVVNEKVIKGPPDDFADNLTVRRYKVQILYKMKGVGGRINGYTTVEAPGNSAMCGMTLTVGQSYVLMGYKSGRKRTINSCGFVRPLSSLSYNQMFYLFTKGPYSYHKSCTAGCTDPGSKYCQMPKDDFSAVDCYSQNSVCMKSKSSCVWYNHESCAPPTRLPMPIIMP